MKEVRGACEWKIPGGFVAPSLSHLPVSLAGAHWGQNPVALGHGSCPGEVSVN